jgi:colanic acid/amylovoran biosynthesis glycosyltransferase
MATLEIAYVLLRFPCLTETFVAQEIWEVEQQGVKVHILSLLEPRSELVHAVSQRLKPRARYAAGVCSLSLWWAQLHFMCKSPRRYFGLLWELLAQPFPRASLLPKRLAAFLKGVHLAMQLEGSSVRLVHSHFAWLSAAAAMVIGRLLDLPFSVTTHAFDIYSEENDLLRLTSGAADHVVTISEYNRQAIRDMCPQVKENLVEVIHCGIDLDGFRPPAQRPDAVDGVLRVLSVGSLLQQKGHEYLIRACGQLTAQGHHLQCTIVGEGRLRKRLEALIAELGLEGVVTLAGSQTQNWVRDALQHNHLFVLACAAADDGARDGIPVAIMEALAMETPVVSTRISGIPELVHHEETGLLVPEKDVTALAAAIARLAKDEALRRRLASAGRKLVTAEFDTHRNVSRLVSLFRRTIEEYEHGH